MELESLKKMFMQIYGVGSIRTFFSPGRVNLIGEHIDYNGGYVFPCALDFGTYACVRIRNDSKVRLASTNFDLHVELELNHVVYDEKDDWANYAKGVIVKMQERGYIVGGMDILVSGNIPNGAGLSSSASLEVLVAVIINNLFNQGSIDRVRLVKLSQDAENNFVGVNCGIMDQFAIGMGKKNKAILLDCNTLNYSYVDVSLQNYILVVMNTNKRRALNDSKYNERRAECEEALKIIRSQKAVNALCELAPEEFDSLSCLIKDENIKKRAKHAVYENYRVKEAYKFLSSGKLKEFGKLLMESHDSLKYLYEVTGKELDTIVYEAMKLPECIGARMTGAGFGGCAIALVEKDKVGEFTETVKNNYIHSIGYEPDFYFSGVGEGTEEIM